MTALFPYGSILGDSCVASSAPWIIGFGDMLEWSPFALSFGYLQPSTVSIALAPRIKAKIGRFKEGWTKVSFNGMSEEHPSQEARFDTPLSVYFLCASHMGATGIHIEITSELPCELDMVRNGASIVSVVNALCKTRVAAGFSPTSNTALVNLACELGRVAGSSLDRLGQIGSAFGGVRQWLWSETTNFGCIDLAPARGQFIEQNLAMVYLPSRTSPMVHRRNSRERFLAGQDRWIWFEISQLVKDFAQALRALDGGHLAALLRGESELRRILGDYPQGGLEQLLVDSAAEQGCGARVSLLDAGTCVWAMGPVEHIGALTMEWSLALRDRSLGCLITPKIEVEGVC